MCYVSCTVHCTQINDSTPCIRTYVHAYMYVCTCMCLSVHFVCMYSHEDMYPRDAVFILVFHSVLNLSLSLSPHVGVTSS